MSQPKPLGTTKLIILTVVATLSIGLLGLLSYRKSHPKQPASRQWMQYAMYVIRNEVRTPPTATARFYAYTATSYQETLAATHSKAQASAVTAAVVNQVFPAYTDRTNQFSESIGSNQTLSTAAKTVLAKYTKRLREDGFNLAWDRKIPVGEDKWHKQIYPPATPRAGDWKPWIIASVADFPAKAPPVYGSPEDLQEVEKVVQASQNRTTQEEADIQFWNGGPGTEGPSGIWLNRLHDEIGTGKSDEDYAYKQKVLAQSLADSFIVSWHIKYTYWTQRPSMRSNQVKLAFHDPPFPSYVSGHSTISSTAATVLSQLVPQKASIWQSDAATAANSRLTAGVHFNYDNVQGSTVGQAIGQQIISKL